MEGGVSIRPSGRAADELRELKFERGFTKHAEGSVLVSFGSTRVLCTASIEDTVPGFLRALPRTNSAARLTASAAIPHHSEAHRMCE